MKLVENQVLEGERAAYGSKETLFRNCTFQNGESPLKESDDIEVNGCTFAYKYPLWYVNYAKVRNTHWETMGRSGVWYSKHMLIEDCIIDAPKNFRRTEDITWNRVKYSDADEVFWGSKGIKITDSYAKGDYFAMNASDIEIENFVLDGNYPFDGCKNVRIKNAKLNSKDSFWNCDNVIVEDSEIDGEYIGWNSKNLTFRNCRIKSHQAFCYIDGLTLENCIIEEGDLVFELCSNVNISLANAPMSIKNPISGRIKLKGRCEIILDEKIIDPSQTSIIFE